MVTGIQQLQIVMSSPMDQNYQKRISKRSKTIQLVIKSSCTKDIQEAGTRAPIENAGNMHMRPMRNYGRKKPCTTQNDAFMILFVIPPTSGLASKSI